MPVVRLPLPPLLAEIERASITITVRGDPVPYVRNSNPHTSVAHFKPVPARQRNMVAQLRLAAESAMNGRPLLDGPLRMVFTATFAIPKNWTKTQKQLYAEGRLFPTKRPDWDNLGKLGSDSFNSIVYKDDAQIVSATVNKVWGDIPGVSITIESL